MSTAITLHITPGPRLDAGIIARIGEHAAARGLSADEYTAALLAREAARPLPRRRGPSAPAGAPGSTGTRRTDAIRHATAPAIVPAAAACAPLQP